MMGLIEQAMQGGQAAGQEQPAAEASAGMPAQPAQAGAETADGGEGGQFKTGIYEQLPEEMRGPFERLVLAGQRIMYSKEMQPEIRKAMSGAGDTTQRVAAAVAGLMGLILRQAKNPPAPVIIPAAIELLHEGADFIAEAGMAKLNDQDRQKAAQMVAVILAKKMGANDQQIVGAMRGGQPVQPAQPAQADGG